VTGSLHILRDAKRRTLLVDVGLVQGADARGVDLRLPFPREIVGADALVLTHVHIDHVGLLPKLVREGFQGRVHMTRATGRLAPVMLADSARIQKQISRKSPLYTAADVTRALKLVEVHDFAAPFLPIPGMKVTFSRAGHVLGAAHALAELEGARRPISVLFSGDIGRPTNTLLRDPEPIPGADYVVMESTYGDRDHTPTPDLRVALRDLIQKTADRGGKVIIPAFSLGRTQTLVYLLNQLFRAGELPKVPFFVDSPLSVEVTRAYREYIPELNDAAREFARGGDPYQFPGLEYVSARPDSRALANLVGPAVYISASGMATAGRILNHLSNHAGDPRNTIALVGYSAPGTPARALQDGATTVRIQGEEVSVLAQVVTLPGFSGHAGQSELLQWIMRVGSQVSQVFLVHGEESVQQEFANRLRSEGYRVQVPAKGDVFPLE
jgi:metallo-beta-lactamase family protein